MKNVLIFMGLLFLGSAVFSQATPAPQATTANDSTDLQKDLEDLLAADTQPFSYFSAEVGVSNRPFNTQNKTLNVKLAPTSKTIFSPSVAWHHKSGLYVSAGASLLNDPVKSFGASEYVFRGGYDLPENDHAEFSAVYSHVAVKDIYSIYSSPIHNDFYAYFIAKKTWLRPGVAVDVSGGEYGDVKRAKLLYDSIDNKLTAFALIPSVSHAFGWQQVLGKEDEISVTPTLMLNMSNSSTRLTHTTNAPDLKAFLNKKGRLPKLENTPFKAQSAGFGLDASYTTGKFSVVPQLYVDYYLPKTTDNRFTDYFTITVRYLIY